MIQLIVNLLLLGWGIYQARNPRKVMERKYPAVDIPERVFHTARNVGIVMAVVGGVGLLVQLLMFLF